MKKIITTAIAVLAFAAIGFSAQTSTVTVTNYVTVTNTIAVPAMSLDNSPSDNWELTLGAGGVVNPNTGTSQTALDFSLAHQFKSLPNVWFGVEQGVSWEPTFAGSTDLNALYAINVYKDLWLNAGWSGGVIYDTQTTPIWRTGPVLQAEYYIGNHTFLYAQGNYDAAVSRDFDNNSNFRWSVGIGLFW